MNFPYLAVALSLTLGLCGCPQKPSSALGEGTKTTVEFHADTSFSKKERSDIQAAADQWRKQTSGLADIVVVYDFDPGSPTDIKKYGDSPILLRRTSEMDTVKDLDDEACDPFTKALAPQECPKILGWVTVPGGVHNHIDGNLQMNLVMDRIPNDTMKVALHEFGHVLGLRHVPDRYSVMFPAQRKDVKACLTQPDISEFCRVNYCGSTKMKPCD